MDSSRQKGFRSGRARLDLARRRRSELRLKWWGRLALLLAAAALLALTCVWRAFSWISLPSLSLLQCLRGRGGSIGPATDEQRREPAATPEHLAAHRAANEGDFHTLPHPQKPEAKLYPPFPG